MIHRAIKLEKDFPLVFLGYETVVSFDQKSKEYSVNTKIEGEKISISNSNPNVIEEEFKSAIQKIVDKK